MQGFAISPFQTLMRCQQAQRRFPLVSMSTDFDHHVSSSSRRIFLASTAAVALAQLIPSQYLKPAEARVDIDTERFGDKGERCISNKPCSSRISISFCFLLSMIFVAYLFIYSNNLCHSAWHFQLRLKNSRSAPSTVSQHLRNTTLPLFLRL